MYLLRITVSTLWLSQVQYISSHFPNYFGKNNWSKKFTWNHRFTYNYIRNVIHKSMSMLLCFNFTWCFGRTSVLIAYLERMLQTYSYCGKNTYMLGDLNEDLLKVNRLEQILNKLNLYQLIKEPTQITPRSKTFIDVIITNNIDTVIHEEHWENWLRFVYVSRWVSSFYAPNCINAPQKHLK